MNTEHRYLRNDDYMFYKTSYVSFIFKNKLQYQQTFKNEKHGLANHL